MKIVIIDYGAGNTKSVLFALERLGIKAVVSADASVIQKADGVIFPGVGHAKPALVALKEKGLDLLIPKLKQPVLGICLGMQLMCTYTEEGDQTCLGIFDASVQRFEIEEKVPHMGWNQIESSDSKLFNGIEKGEYVYFVHSYYVPTTGSTSAKSVYGIEFSAALEKNNFYACQFHPEKSGETGEKIMKNFIKICESYQQ
jgi:glutamine amidotransferase